MVYVFPLPVWPYANTVARPPETTKGIKGAAVQIYLHDRIHKVANKYIISSQQFQQRSTSSFLTHKSCVLSSSPNAWSKQKSVLSRYFVMPSTFNLQLWTETMGLLVVTESWSLFFTSRLEGKESVMVFLVLAAIPCLCS